MEEEHEFKTAKSVYITITAAKKLDLIKQKYIKFNLSKFIDQKILEFDLSSDQNV